MKEKIKASLTSAWIRLRYEETGAQTLEWLALALLIIGILAAGDSLANKGEVASALKQKFIDMVNKIN